MKIYVDMCALKRPFDDQAFGRVFLEAEAVIRVLKAADVGLVSLCNSVALVAENDRNPDPLRRSRVEALLDRFGTPRPVDKHIFSVATTLHDLGLSPFDSLHLAFAERLKAVYFLTCDEQILRKGPQARLKVKIMDPISFVRELNL